MAKGDLEGAGGAAASGAAMGASIGSVIPGVGTAVGAVVGAAAGFIGKSLKNRRDRRKADKLAKERPVYQINEEAYDNQALAKARAFGRDRTIQMAEENVDSGMASAVGQAKNISGNTGAVLDTLRAISMNGMETKRDLATQEVGMRNQRMGELYDANNAMIDEKDKAWNYNVNEPYQNKVQELRQKRRYQQERDMKAMDFAGTMAASYFNGAGGGMMAKGGGGGGGSGASMAPIDGYGNSFSTYG